jgi:hypothetical protein
MMRMSVTPKLAMPTPDKRRHLRPDFDKAAVVRRYCFSPHRAGVGSSVVVFWLISLPDPISRAGDLPTKKAAEAGCWQAA